MKYGNKRTHDYTYGGGPGAPAEQRAKIYQNPSEIPHMTLYCAGGVKMPLKTGDPADIRTLASSLCLAMHDMDYVRLAAQSTDEYHWDGENWKQGPKPVPHSSYRDRLELIHARAVELENLIDDERLACASNPHETVDDLVSLGQIHDEAAELTAYIGDKLKLADLSTPTVTHDGDDL